MNRLPAHRQVVAGRTWGRMWRPEDYAPITHHPAGTPTERVAGVVLAVVLGVLGAAALLHWWGSA